MRTYQGRRNTRWPNKSDFSSLTTWRPSQTQGQTQQAELSYNCTTGNTQRSLLGLFATTWDLLLGGAAAWRDADSGSGGSGLALVAA